MTDENKLPQSSIRSPRRRWLRQAFLGFVILICGALIGSGLTLRFLWGTIITNIHEPEKMTKRIVGRIDRRLHLNDKQIEKVEEIVSRKIKTIRALRLEIQPRVEAELKGMQIEIKDLLVTKQIPQWDKEVERFRKRWFISKNKDD